VDETLQAGLAPFLSLVRSEFCTSSIGLEDSDAGLCNFFFFLHNNLSLLIFYSSAFSIINTQFLLLVTQTPLPPAPRGNKRPRSRANVLNQSQRTRDLDSDVMRETEETAETEPLSVNSASRIDSHTDAHEDADTLHQSSHQPHTSSCHKSPKQARRTSSLELLPSNSPDSVRTILNGISRIFQ
jgi:hypothetical protein